MGNALKAVSREELAALYQEMTTAEMAKQFGINAETIRKRMIELDIPRRNRGGRRSFTPSRDELHALYQHKSMKQIARQYDVGETVVWKRLKEFGIVLKDYEDGGHRKKPGRQFSRDHRKALSQAHRGKWAGERNPHWKGGAHAQNMRLRQSGAYKQWRLDALALRGNRCQRCGAEHGMECACCGTRIKLHVHHVASFAAVPERRFDPENSEVLCPKCHHSRHHGKSGEFGETPNA